MFSQASFDDLFKLCSLKEWPYSQRLDYLQKFSKSRDACLKDEGYACDGTNATSRQDIRSADKLLNWLKQDPETVVNEKLEFLVLNPVVGLTVRAKADIQKEETLLKVPLKFAMRASGYLETEMIKKHEDIPDWFLSALKMDEAMQLVLVLLDEQRKPKRGSRASFYQPYLSSLSTKFPPLPLFMSSEELEDLKGSPQLEQILKTCLSVCRRFFLIRKVFAEVKFRDYLMATGIVMSRQNNVSADGEKGLLPLLDLFNHANYGTFTTFVDSDSFESHAFKSFTAGEEMFMYYGPRSNFELFFYAGFVVENLVEADVIQLAIGKDQVSLHYRSFETIESCQEVAEQQLKSSTFESVHAMANFLLIRFKLLLKAYPTSIEDDEEILSKGVEVKNRVCIQFRREEKRMLHAFISDLERIIAENK